MIGRRAVRYVIPVLAVAAGIGVSRWVASYRRHRLPGRIRLDHVVDHLDASLSQATVVAEPAPGAVRRDWLLTGNDLRGARQAIVAPPPATIAYRLRAPDDGALSVAVGVASAEHRDPHAAGVRFAVAVDGREVFARVVDPIANTHDDHWRDARIDLASEAGRDVEIALSTRALRDGPLAGTPGWGRVETASRHAACSSRRSSS